MKISQKYSEWIKIGITLFVAVILYELLIVQLLGNRSYDLRVGHYIILFSPRQQFIPVLLLSFFTIYFIGEFKHKFKRPSRNLVVLGCGIALLVLTFLFAGHIHQLYYTFLQKFEALPKNVATPKDVDVTQAELLLTARNVLLGLDAVLCLCMVYLWYNWAKV